MLVSPRVDGKVAAVTLTSAATANTGLALLSALWGSECLCTPTHSIAATALEGRGGIIFILSLQMSRLIH